MAVYLDVIWLLNVLFDTLLLYLTSLILKRSIPFWRIFGGGLIGSIIILLSVTPFNAYIGHPVVKVLFSVLMVLFVFGYKRFKYFITSIMIFYLTTFLLGGTLVGIHYLIRFDMDLSSSLFLANIQGFGDPVSWLFVVLAFPVAWQLSKKSFDRIEVTKIQYEQLVKVEIILGEQILCVTGLIDSGNQLYDPISRQPVMFVSIKKMKDELPEDFKLITDCTEDVIMGNCSIGSQWENRMRIIPYKVMGRDHQLIIAMKPEKIIIKQNQETMIVEKGLISFTNQELSSDDAFQCIVHPKMLVNARKVERLEPSKKVEVSNFV